MIGENRAVDTTTLNTTQRWKLFQELLQYLEILKHTWTCDRCGKKRKACQNNINSEKDQSKNMCKKVTSETSHMEPSKKTGDVEKKWRSFPKRQFLEKIPSDIPENHRDNRKTTILKIDIYIYILSKESMVIFPQLLSCLCLSSGKIRCTNFQGKPMVLGSHPLRSSVGLSINFTNRTKALNSSLCKALRTSSFKAFQAVDVPWIVVSEDIFLLGKNGEIKTPVSLRGCKKGKSGALFYVLLPLLFLPHKHFESIKNLRVFLLGRCSCLVSTKMGRFPDIFVKQSVPVVEFGEVHEVGSAVGGIFSEIKIRRSSFLS